MTYRPLFCSALVTITVVFVSIWLVSRGDCPQLTLRTPFRVFQCDIVNGTIDISFHHDLGVRRTYGWSFYADPETRFKSDAGWGRWGKNRITAFSEPGATGYKYHAETIPEGAWEEDFYRKQSDIPATATIAAETTNFLFPLWLPFLVIIAAAFLIYRLLTLRVEARQKALVAGLGEQNAM